MIGKNDIHAFIIHLMRASARKSQVDRILAACPLQTHVVEAVDGQTLSAQEVDAAYSSNSLHAPCYPFKLGVGEVGCFLSHRKAWQAILDQGLEAGLVIEDDVEMDRVIFAEALDLARANIADSGVIQFQVRDIKNSGPVTAIHNDVRLTQPAVVPLRASCTLYSRSAIKQLLGQTERFDRPIDTYLQMHWVTGLRPRLAIPSGVHDKGREIGGTTIQVRNKPMSERLVREVLRPLYRAKVLAYSRLNDRPKI